MQRRPRFLPTLAVWLVLAGPSANRVVAQAPPTPDPGPPAFAQPAPPPPPPANDLFPDPGSTRPAPPILETGELRSTGGRPQRGKKPNAGGGRFSGERRRQAINPALVTAATDPVEVRIAYRRAETEAKRDPMFVDLLRQADLAASDEERRAFLRRYYTELFTRVRRINGSPALATHVAVLSRAAEIRYAPKRRAGGPDERDAGRAGRGQR